MYSCWLVIFSPFIIKANHIVCSMDDFNPGVELNKVCNFNQRVIPIMFQRGRECICYLVVVKIEEKCFKKTEKYKANNDSGQKVVCSSVGVVFIFFSPNKVFQKSMSGIYLTHWGKEIKVLNIFFI